MVAALTCTWLQVRQRRPRLHRGAHPGRARRPCRQLPVQGQGVCQPLRRDAHPRATRGARAGRVRALGQAGRGEARASRHTRADLSRPPRHLPAPLRLAEPNGAAARGRLARPGLPICHRELPGGLRRAHRACLPQRASRHLPQQAGTCTCMCMCICMCIACACACAQHVYSMCAACHTQQARLLTMPLLWLQVLCRYGCELTLPREEMAAHALECDRLYDKRFPVCDGYCCRRAGVAHEEDTFLPPRHRQRPASGRGSASSHRQSWMMQESVAVHWKPIEMKPVRRPPTSGHTLERRGGTFALQRLRTRSEAWAAWAWCAGHGRLKVVPFETGRRSRQGWSVHLAKPAGPAAEETGQTGRGRRGRRGRRV